MAVDPQEQHARPLPRSESRGDSIYAYETKQGTRYRFAYRDSRGKQSQKRGFTSRTAAKRERERLMGRVHRGEVRIHAETFGQWWERWLIRRKPYLAERVLPRLRDLRAPSAAAPLRRPAAEQADRADDQRLARGSVR
jgi:hypothetical protein